MAEEKQNTIDFFISYNGTDKIWAEWIAWQLEEAGFSTILQGWDFRPGANFVMKMQEASEKSKRTVAVLSPNYLKADFTQPEWAVAFRRDPQGKNGILVPIMVHDCKQGLEGLWPQIIYVNLVSLSEQAAHKALMEGINRGRNKPNIPPIFPGTIQHNEAEEPRFPERKGSISSAEFSEAKSALPKLRLNRSFNTYKVRDEWIDFITLNLQEAIEGEESLSFYSDNESRCRKIRILFRDKTIYALDIYKGSMGESKDDEGISFSYAEGRPMFDNGVNAWGKFKWDSKKEIVVLDLFGMLSYPGINKDYTKEEVLYALWDKIRPAIERSAR